MPLAMCGMSTLKSVAVFFLNVDELEKGTATGGCLLALSVY